MASVGCMGLGPASGHLLDSEQHGSTAHACVIPACSLLVGWFLPGGWAGCGSWRRCNHASDHMPPAYLILQELGWFWG